MFFFHHGLSSLPMSNLFHYVTFRTMGAIFTSFLFVFFLGDCAIHFLKRLQKQGQPIRSDGPETHFTKQGTPTMGGGLILLSLVSNTLLWGDMSNPFLWIALIITLGFGTLGAYDDYLKLTKNTHNGLAGRHKIFVQIILSFMASYTISLYMPDNMQHTIDFPFLKGVHLDLGGIFFLWTIFVIVGSSNAVNLTDGLDGLAIVPVMFSSMCFCIISYLVGHKIFSHYLHLSFIPMCGEIPIFLGALIGAGLGFLWFNAPPAKVFMGDTGSLAVGGALGTISIMTKNEFVWAIIGGLFVIESISVILQVGFYKITKRRIFLMAPIHHHFEKKGWAESTVVIRFWIISALLALLGLLTLKIR